MQVERHQLKDLDYAKEVLLKLKDQDFIIKSANYIAYVDSYHGYSEVPREFSHHIRMTAEQIVVQRKAKDAQELKIWIINEEEKPTIITGKKRYLRLYFLTRSTKYQECC